MRGPRRAPRIFFAGACGNTLVAGRNPRHRIPESGLGRGNAPTHCQHIPSWPTGGLSRDHGRGRSLDRAFFFAPAYADDVSSALQICPSCAGQLATGAQSCPWCGISLLEDEESTRVAPASKPPVTRADVGFGGAAERPLPPLPPPPRSLPFEKLNGAQIIMRVIVVVIVAWLIAMFAKEALHTSACQIPDSRLCIDSNRAP